MNCLPARPCFSCRWSTIAAVFALVVFSKHYAAAEEDDAAVRARALRAEAARQAGAPLARWFSGQVEYQGTWMSLAEAQETAAGDERLTEYRRLRGRMEDRVHGHAWLARWCARQDLDELAEVHWRHVLRFEPHHRAALGALGRQWVEGTLMTADEAEQYRKAAREDQRRAQSWQGQVQRIARGLEHEQVAEREQAQADLLKIDDPAAVPALVDELAPADKDEAKTQARRVHLLNTLGQIDATMATDVLLDFAASSTSEPVRYAAVQQLKKKPTDEVVPQLLSALRMPVEGSVTVGEVGNELVSWYSLEQEGADGETYETSYSTSSVIPGRKYSSAAIFQRRKVRDAYTIPEQTIPGHFSPCGGYWVPERVVPERHVDAQYRTEYVGTLYGSELAEYQQTRNRVRRSAQDAASALERQVAEHNRQLAGRNGQIAGVLRELTGQQFDNHPKTWWNWWQDHVGSDPDVAVSDAVRRVQQAMLAQEPQGLARGTWVWTLAGQIPIEEVGVGDFLLSQNPTTGELTFKPVVTAGHVGKQEVAALEVAGGSITCVPSQLFWAAGPGWRRARDLAGGHSLHGVHAAAESGELLEAYPIDAYQAVVKDFHTMFVGESGLLTHDASPVAATSAPLPGLPRQVVKPPGRVALNRFP